MKKPGPSYAKFDPELIAIIAVEAKEAAYEVYVAV